MFDFGVPSWQTVVIVSLAAYLAVDLWRLNRFGHAYTIQELTLGDRDGGQRLLLMRGRSSGLAQWLGTLLGLSADVRLEVTKAELSLERMSLFGFDAFYVPMHDLSSSRCGYYRAISLLLVALSLVVNALLQVTTAWIEVDPYARLAALTVAGRSAMISAVAAVVAYGLYGLSKRIIVSVETGGGVVSAVAFKRNVIENVTIGMEQALEAVAVLNDAMLTAGPPHGRGMTTHAGGVR